MCNCGTCTEYRRLQSEVAEKGLALSPSMTDSELRTAVQSYLDARAALERYEANARETLAQHQFVGVTFGQLSNGTMYVSHRETFDPDQWFDLLREESESDRISQ
jgi:hypothetical protein